MITSVDSALINNRARRWIISQNPELLDEVAEMLLIAADEEERFSIRWGWNEGVRDYAESEDEVNWSILQLVSRAETLRRQS